ncbi:hypothetical protein GGS20DRAFT_545618 [Poronia punctata]|nr:hypothetical protein GGS20DRAFT_545618 [Poronia punctata]
MVHTILCLISCCTRTVVCSFPHQYLFVILLFALFLNSALCVSNKVLIKRMEAAHSCPNTSATSSYHHPITW